MSCDGAPRPLREFFQLEDLIFQSRFFSPGFAPSPTPGAFPAALRPLSTLPVHLPRSMRHLFLARHSSISRLHFLGRQRLRRHFIIGRWQSHGRPEESKWPAKNNLTTEFQILADRSVRDAIQRIFASSTSHRRIPSRLRHKIQPDLLSQRLLSNGPSQDLSFPSPIGSPSNDRRVQNADARRGQKHFVSPRPPIGQIDVGFPAAGMSTRRARVRIRPA